MTDMRHAAISFNEQGTPVADNFDDVYFSNASGLQESDYVFLKNNGLPERFGEHQGAFVIAETGFGTGLNFLAAWRAFRQHRGPAARLHFISTEKYPLSQADLATALAAWPQLAELSQQLQDAYPPALPGCHRLLFDNGLVTLDLWLGDIKELLPSWQCPAGGLVDAWFLDGFAPAKNPDMWQPALFAQMARLAKPGGTFATFTAAGFVRRGLLAAGFDAQKVPGFGRKRDMLAGALVAPKSKPAPALYDRPEATDTDSIAIIGAGLAGASCAWQLRRRGIKATLFCQDSTPATGASGNPQGAMYPLLNLEHDAVSQLFASAYGYSRRIVRTSGVTQGLDGLLQLALDDKLSERYQRLADTFAPLCRYVDADEASTLAGLPQPYPALYFADAGWLRPPALVNWLLADTPVHPNTTITAIKPATAGGWQLFTEQQSLGVFSQVILAAGAGNIDFAEKLPLTAVRGQISTVPASKPLTALKTVLCHNGYMTPADNGSLCIGASFIRQDRNCELRDSEHQDNLAKVARSFPDASWCPETVNGGNAGTRVVLRDHLPVVGALPDSRGYHGQDITQASATAWDGLWLLGGLGARGVTSALLCADVLVSQMLAEPQPLPTPVLDAIMPNRFWVRKLKKGQAID
ncbi:bifunctional tRNA (5-methylaminomethyl-2-thiouridine)(34)-methyltransferase MnmD/FAD-dependent 5-carboxymethylaminomethyl-2-thiouridine(34) oxidoreductase MnmC [Gallaecimonas sp. GXIMD1310]|uniref:bifunctional tRNA (5-methylaminomethyl-2-thiouridine)(34)-methyltransferase MnmD/FAD-dependent 5-carboxymethylaminomethyl-2-thiouridine(34) oxidoreductase MnmC n=1 Tax=Gallaecimonas sp. GXIMD1310 TaxID=3131926 RepID=UPI003249637A